MMMITAATFLENARKALENKTLQLFDPNLHRDSFCTYLTDDGKFTCAIGASFTPEQARELGCDLRISHLIDDGVIETDDPRYADQMQRKHDSLVMQLGRGFITREYAIAEFARWLDQ